MRLLVICMIVALAGCTPQPCDQDKMSFGSFVVECALSGGRVDDGGSLSVTHVQSPDTPLWSSREGAAFLTAGTGQETVSFGSGSFQFEDALVRQCLEPVIERVASEGEGVVVEGTFDDCDSGFAMRMSAIDEHRLDVSVTLDDASLNRISWVGASEANEGFYGFGAQYNYLNHKGLVLPIWSQEQGHGRGSEPLTTLLGLTDGNAAGDWSTSYTAVPYTVSDRGRGLYLEQSEYLTFDMSAEDRIAVNVWSGQLKARLIHGTTPAEIVSRYTEYTGRMDPLPTWSQEGVVVRLYGGSDKIRTGLAELEAAGTPVAAVWVEDWCGLRTTGLGTRIWWNWDVDRGRYPDWEQFVSELQADGIRVLAYINPFLADPAEKPDLGRNLFEEATKAGHLVKNPDGQTYLIDQGGFDAGLVDLSSPEARAWLKQVMVDLIGTGVRGWMADFGEALPYDAVLSSGVEARVFHNQFPYEWAKLVKEASIEAEVRDEFVSFNRSGNAKSPGEARLFWLGDQTVTWDEYDGLQTVIPGLLNAGLSGYALDHSDVGGYLSVKALEITRGKELFQRWMELASFTPFLRLHSTNQAEDNHQYDSDEETLEHFTEMSKLFASLAPYRQTLMLEAQKTGLPLVRHLMLHYPDDPEVYGLMQQFMLGPDMIVAPVVKQGAKTVKVYLPQGEWTHLWSKESVSSEGSWVTVDAPIGKPAAYLRNGSEPFELLIP